MDYSDELYGKTNSELIMELGSRFKEYRITCRMTQKDVAEHAGISLFTVKAFESGRTCNVTMNSFVSMLRAIGFLDEINKLLPELPPTPDMIEKTNKLKPRRVKKWKIMF